MPGPSEAACGVFTCAVSVPRLHAVTRQKTDRAQINRICREVLRSLTRVGVNIEWKTFLALQKEADRCRAQAAIAVLEGDGYSLKQSFDSGSR